VVFFAVVCVKYDCDIENIIVYCLGDTGYH